MPNETKKKIILAIFTLEVYLFSNVLFAQVYDDQGPSFSAPQQNNNVNNKNDGGYSSPNFQPPSDTNNNTIYVKDQNGNLITSTVYVYDPTKISNCSNSQPGEVCS